MPPSTDIDNEQPTTFRPVLEAETETDINTHTYAAINGTESSDDDEERYVDNEVNLKPVFPPVPLKKPIAMGVELKASDIKTEADEREERRSHEGGGVSELRRALEKRQTGKEGVKEEGQRKNAPTPPTKPSKPSQPTEESKENSRVPKIFIPQPPSKPKKDEPSPPEKKKEDVREEVQRRNAPTPPVKPGKAMEENKEKTTMPKTFTPQPPPKPKQDGLSPKEVVREEAQRKNPPAPPAKPGKPTEERKEIGSTPQPPPKPKADGPSPHPIKAKPIPPTKPKLEEHSEPPPKASKPAPPAKPKLVNNEKEKEGKPTPPRKPPAIADCGESITSKPKPKPGPKPAGVGSDTTTTSHTPVPVPKPRARAPARAQELGSGWPGSGKTHVESCRVPVEKLGEQVDSLQAENSAGFLQQFEVNDR